MASLPTSSILLLVLLVVVVGADAATFTVINKCQYTVWAAAVPSGGGKQLDAGQTWTINVPAGTTGGRVWARTGCSFDGAGNGRCQTGDCGGKLQCAQYGQAPNTLAEFGLNKYMNLDFFDISLIEGYNVPMSFLPAPGSPGCPKGGPRCPRVITPQCPGELRTVGGCNNACPAFREDRYCCVGSAKDNCGPTNYSRFFKGQCPDAYSYPKDDATSTYTCPGGTNYQLWRCFKTPEHTIDLQDIDLQEDLSYREHPVAIFEKTERKTRNKSIKFLKVKWYHHSDKEATWEHEDLLRFKFPEFFRS